MGGRLQLQPLRALPLQGGHQCPASHGGIRGSGCARLLKNSKKRANETPWVKPTRVRRCRTLGSIAGVTAAGLWQLGCRAGGVLSPLPRHRCHLHPARLARGSSATLFLGARG